RGRRYRLHHRRIRLRSGRRRGERTIMIPVSTQLLRRSAFFFSTLLVCIPATYSRADDRPLIEQALDEPGRITLDNIRLGDAIKKVSEQTGVNIVMPESAMRLTPQGPNTIIKKVDIARIPLREGLQKL